MEEFSKNGRKLRPRKAKAEIVDSKSSEHRSFGERRNFGRPGERRSFGDHKSFGERRSFGEGRPESGERRSFGDHKPSGERRSFGRPGEHRSFGERRGFGGEHKPFGERKSFGEGRPESGERRSFEGSRKPSFGGPRKPFAKGGKPSSRRTGPTFDRKSDEGIDRMISRRPQPKAQDWNADSMPFVNQEEMRLNKFIANSGVCSRREADTLIQAGVVTVNGEVVTELGVKVNTLKDDIRFNGERLKGEDKVYIVMNKPKGYVTTASDPHADKTVMELLKGCTARVFPVGRLDKATTGVLMFTNDGEIAERLTHPSYDKKKIYQVILNRDLKQEDYDQILSGVSLSDGMVNADELEFIDAEDKRKLGIEIHSGKNRVVRRIFESLGYEVRALDRVYFAGLTKKGLKKGEWRQLTEGEVNILKMGAYV